MPDEPVQLAFGWTAGEDLDRFPQPVRHAAFSHAPLVRRASGDGAMTYTLSEAARAAGRGKTTLLRMIRSGKLSATRDPVTGGWLVEPAELHRLYPPVHRDTAQQP